jgi:hypothetical protein
MTPEDYLERARAEVIGQEVSYRRLAGNSLLVYVDCVPGDPPSAGGTSFWLEPPWHLRDEERVLAGSRQAQEDKTADDPLAGFRAVGETLDVLLGRKVEDVQIEPVTNSLVLSFSGQLQLRTFVTDPTEELDDWDIWVRGTHAKLLGNAKGLEVLRKE